MSATIPLLRVQFHFLFWPIVASAVCLLVYLLTPTNYWENRGVVVLVQLTLGIVVWLSAPLLHGGEYMEGARLPVRFSDHLLIDNLLDPQRLGLPGWGTYPNEPGQISKWLLMVWIEEVLPGAGK